MGWSFNSFKSGQLGWIQIYRMRNSRINVNKCHGSQSYTDMMQTYTKVWKSKEEEKVHKIWGKHAKACKKIQKNSKVWKSMQKDARACTHAHWVKSTRKVLGKNWESTKKVLGMFW